MIAQPFTAGRWTTCEIYTLYEWVSLLASPTIDVVLRQFELSLLSTN